MNWLDANGVTLNVDEWYIIPGQTGGPHTVIGEGPTNGTQFFLTLQSITGNTVIDTLNVYENSRPYNFSDWRTRTSTNFAFAAASSAADIAEKHLIVGHRNIAAQGAGVTDTTLMGLFAGKVRFYANSASATSDLLIQVRDIADQSAAVDIIYANKTDGNGNINTEFQLPRAQSEVVMTNNNAAAKNTRWIAIIEEY
jgi:hypothetical protein